MVQWAKAPATTKSDNLTLIIGTNMVKEENHPRPRLFSDLCTQPSDEAAEWLSH